MKGGIAAELMAIKVLKDVNIKLAGEIILETVVDEEYLCNVLVKATIN